MIIFSLKLLNHGYLLYSRAQKAFMTVELEYGKRFTYGAFMEFSFLRVLLRHLAVVSQLSCEELDIARVNILKETQRNNQITVKACDLVPESLYYMYCPETESYKPFVHNTRDLDDTKKNEMESQTIGETVPR